MAPVIGQEGFKFFVEEALLELSLGQIFVNKVEGLAAVSLARPSTEMKYAEKRFNPIFLRVGSDNQGQEG